MPHAYAERATAVAALTDLLGGPPPERAETLLDSAAGTNDAGTVYRPHIVAALTMANARSTTRLHSADGAQFDAPITTIRALIAEQAAWDANLDVPQEWSAAAVRARLLGGSTASRLAHVTTSF